MGKWSEYHFGKTSWSAARVTSLWLPIYVNYTPDDNVKHEALVFTITDGDTDKEKAIVDMIIDEAMDLRHGIIKITYTSVENYVRFKAYFGYWT